MSTTQEAANEPRRVGVLVVGAGTTGLTLAIELARKGVSYLLIDKASSRPTSSRAIGTQARTIETFDLMGIPESLLVPSVRPRAFRFAERERTLARVAFDDRPGGSPALISMDQSDTERVLERRLAELGGEIAWRTELLAFRVVDDEIVATVEGPDGQSGIRARFLVGTDGAHSTVRHEAGIDFLGEAYPERFLLADLDLDWELPHDEGHVWIGDDGLVAAIPLPGDRRYRVIIPLPPDESAVEFDSEAEIAELAETLLRQRTGLRLRRIGEAAWASSFRISRRQAERYREGPVFLAGDAAHVHSPVGGQGMNMGIQDAFNLGWKLALAVDNEAAPGLLATYQEERHPIARGVLLGTHLGTRLVLAGNPIARALRERIVPAMARMPPVRRQLLNAVSQLQVAYPDSPLSIDADTQDLSRGLLHREESGLRAGDRVPDGALLAVPGAEPVRLFELISQGWTLLLFAGERPALERLAQLDLLARQTRDTVGDEVSAYLVLDTLAESAAVTPRLLDPVGELTRSFGAREGLAILIRPDGYLGYRGRPSQELELASYLARVFAMRIRGAG